MTNCPSKYCHEVNDEDLRKDVHDKCYDKAYAVAKAGCADKHWLSPRVNTADP